VPAGLIIAEASPVVAGSKPAPPASVEEYLAAVSEEARSALEALRSTIRASAPHAEEEIRYQMPVFTYHGLLVGMAAMKGHLGFYVMSPSVLEAHATELRGYDVGKGCIRFSPERPLPVTLVRKIVKARMAENERA